MKLNSRAGFLILPVILIGHLIAVLYIYDVQSESLQQYEQAKLENRAASLKSAFSSYSHSLSSFLISIQQGDRFKAYLSERNDRYRRAALGVALKELVGSYQENIIDYISLAIISPKSELVYYYENSADPFAAMPTENFDVAKSIYQNKDVTHWSFKNNKLSTVIMQAAMIDTRTLALPLSTHLDNTVLMLATIRAVGFDRGLAELKEEYPIDISFSVKPEAPVDGLWSEVELAKGQFLQLRPKYEYLEQIKLKLKLSLIVTVLFSSFITFMVLQYLIRKYITRPISYLDERLDAVLSGEVKNLGKLDGCDEVSRLGLKFHNLYEELSQTVDETTKLSKTDSLTGLPNRMAFYEIAQKKLEAVKKTKSAMGFIYIDLDNFKFVNDKYGHDIGDELLKAFAKRLIHLIDRVSTEGIEIDGARLSGDEFIIAFSGMTRDDGIIFFDKVLHIFSKGFSFERGLFPVTTSLGIARFPDDGHTVTQLISNADIAMYQAKSRGKNRYEFYSKSLAEKSRRSMDIENQLKSLVCDDEFFLVYMPVLDANSKVVGCEALLRWNSPALGFVGPDEFIPLAESTGLFEKVDFWVIEQSIKSFEEIEGLFSEGFVLAINISSAQLSSNRVHLFILEMLSKYQVKPESIELEITETFGVEQTENVLHLLRDIRSSGIKIAIDDFGAGHTSLMQMIDYPVDKIKLDKSFIDRVAGKNKTKIISAITHLCHLQHVTVTAEGVESLEQKRELIEAKCDYLQGYFFSKPLTMKELKVYSLSTDFSI